MNWRKGVAVSAGALLALPLLALLWVLLKPEVPPETPPGVRVSPVLTDDQRMRLVTYGRRCGPNGECEAPLGCLFDVRYTRSTCTDSQCLTDPQCPEDATCRILTTWGGGPSVRRCIPVGLRKEGEGCIDLAPDKEHACVADLLCGGQDGWCSRPCRPGDTTGCPKGFFCADTTPQPVCLPTCETQECPPDQQCIPFKEGSSVCARVYGPNCRQTPCPDGRKCDVAYEPPHPGKVWMECVEECGEGLPPCGTGKVCDGYHCLPACDPHGPEVCGEGYHCSRRGEDRPFSCQPTYWDEQMARRQLVSPRSAHYERRPRAAQLFRGAPLTRPRMAPCP